MNLTLIKETLDKQPYIFQKRALASLAIVDGIDQILTSFNNRVGGSSADILLDVYGLFQTLFVGIDALYDLVIGTTQYKYHININQNQVLRELKYVRNDIVGHPTNRTYEAGTYGFSVIREEVLTREELVYDTYIVNKNNTTHTFRKIIFKELIDAFIAEKTTILEGLINFIENKPIDANCIGLTYSLVNKAINHQYDLKDLEKIRQTYFSITKNKIDKHDRFIWRLDLLEILYVWHNNDFNDFIEYLRCQQAYKLYEIACDLNAVTPVKVFIGLPKVLAQFYRFLKKMPTAINYLDTMTDQDHPLFEINIKKIIKLNPPKSVVKLLNWVLRFNDSRYVYIIGQALKAYKKK